MAFNYVQAQRFLLSGSGVGLADTTIVVNDFETPDGVALTMADFGAIGYAVVEPNSIREEIISFTGVTDNGNGTWSLTGATRGLGFVSPYGADASRRQAHAGGSTLIITNAAPFYDKLAGKENDETVNGLWSFAQFPKKSGSTTPVAADDMATKAYVDLIGTGTAVTDELLVGGLAGETVAAGEVVYFKEADQRWWFATAATPATVDDVKLGIAQNAATAGVAVTVLIAGTDKNLTGLTPGSKYYISDTPGALSTTPGTTSLFLGWAKSATEFVLAQREISIPTGSEKAALVGTAGTPSATNPFVTDDDTTGTGLVLRESTVASTFGGDGSDGALLITSGTTNIDLLGAERVVKNYTSIEISGTGALTFSNPHTKGTHVVFKSQGDVKFTSSATQQIDLRSLGGTGGTAGVAGGGAGGNGGESSFYVLSGHRGQGGAQVSINQGGLGGTLSFGRGLYISPVSNAKEYGRIIAPGAGGGGGQGGRGGASNGAGGAGGRGAGSLYIECKGAYTASGTVVNASGVAGSSGASGASGGGGGGGGGGAGGAFVIFYGSLVSDTGVYTVTAGAAGSGGSGTANDGGAGGGGGGIMDNSGTDGASNPGAATGRAGGVGATGVVIKILNSLVT